MNITFNAIIIYIMSASQIKYHDNVQVIPIRWQK